MPSTRARKALIVVEVALAVVLVIGAGLLAGTLWSLSHVPLGFEPDHVLTLRTALPVTPQSRYNSFAARTNFYTEVLQRVSAIPGVVSAGYTTFLPLTNAGGTSGFIVEGAPPPAPGQIDDANHRVVSDKYLQTIGVRLRSGRFFSESDGATAPNVAIINQAMAREYWRGRNPLAHRFRFDDPGSPWFTIVGVVDDVRQMGLDVNGRAEMYFPYTQAAGTFGYFTPRDLAVRVSGDPLSYERAVRNVIRQVDPNQPVSDVMPMTDLIANKLAWRDTAVKLIAAFAVIALLLAALGLYGLLAYTVTQRTREIGLRMALGAPARQIFEQIVGEGLRLTIYGIALGGFAAWLVTRSLASLLYGISPSDPRVLVGGALTLAAVGMIAAYIPAHRAAAIDPMSALKHE